MRLPQIVILLILLPAYGVQNAGEQTLTPIYERPYAPPFSLPDIYGNTVSLSDFKGEILVVNFWASWCPACINEMQSMQHGANWLGNYRGRFVAINMGEEPEIVTRFLTGRNFDIPVLLDKDGIVSSLWGIKRLPATYVVDTKGRLAYQALGARQWDDPALLVPLRSLGMEE